MTDYAASPWLRWETLATAAVVVALAVAGYLAGHRSGTSPASADGVVLAVPDGRVVPVRTGLHAVAAIPGLAQPPRRTRRRVAPATTTQVVTAPVVAPAAPVIPPVTPPVTPTPAATATPTTPVAPTTTAPTNAGKAFDESG